MLQDTVQETHLMQFWERLSPHRTSIAENDDWSDTFTSGLRVSPHSPHLACLSLQLSFVFLGKSGFPST